MEDVEIHFERRRGRPVEQIKLNEVEEDFLQRFCRKRNGPIVKVKRAKAILLMAQGVTNKEIAKQVGFCAATIGTLRTRFAQVRLESLSDMPRNHYSLSK